MKPRLRRLAKIIAALTLLLPAAPAGAQQVTGSAVLHRDTIVEGQTRAFQISEIPTRPEYYLHASVGGAFTAEAGDVTITTNNLLGQAQTVTPDSDGPRAYPDAIYGQIRFEVTANADSDGADDESFGVRLCTTANCSGGTVLGEWTVTITEPEADTSVSGATGATVTIPGGSRLTMMESSANDDSRDRQAALRITLAASPTADLVLVARTLDTVATGPDEDGNPTTRPIARGVGPNSPDAPEFDVEVARWSSGATGADLTREAVFYANDNVVDAAGGVHTGNFSFRLLQVNHATYTDGSIGNGAVYAGVIIPNVPYSVIDDEPTRVRVLPLGTPDNEDTEGSATDTAKFRVRIDRALAGSEELKVPLRFTGATLGTEFTIALDGSPSGASLNATTGVLTFSGAGAREATVVVTAASDDGNTVAESLRVNIPQYSDPWHERHFGTNLAGGACSGTACPDYDSGEGGQRGYRMTLVEAGPGLVIIDTGDSRIEEGDFYEYWVRLNAAPAAAVTVAISTSPADKVSFSGTRTLPDPTRSLTFTTGDWMTSQRVRLVGRGASNFDTDDDPDLTITLTHEISSSDSTYNALADVTHTLTYLDDDPTSVSMSGASVRASPSDTNISKVMLEGDATRVDRSLTVTLSRALVEGEVARIPLILHAEGHSTADGECDTSGDGAPSERIQHCSIVEGLRGPRISANVAWPLHHNDFVMAATGTGVRIEGVNRYTPNYRGYRILEFRGAGAQTATFALHARDGFNDGDTFDEEISIRPLTRDEIAALFGTRFHAGIDTEPDTPGAAAWFGIDDDEPPEGDGILVPGNWPLLPPGLNAGDKFRLLYVTNSETAAATRDIAHYDSFVRAEITGAGLKAGGVNDLKAHANSFRAIASTADPDSQGNVRRRATYLQAVEHAMFAPYPPWRDEHPDEPIYWVGGGKVADNNRDFVDNDGWDSESPRYADGTAATVHTDGYWTGTHSKGGLHGSKSLETERTGQPTYCDAGRVSAVGGDELLVMGSTLVHVGYLGGSGTQKPLGILVNDASVGTTASHRACTGAPNSEMRPMYALSGVFAVGSGGVTIENASAAEGSAITFTVTLPGDYTNSAGVTVPYTLADGRGVTGDPAYVVATGADYTSTAGSVAIPANSSSATFSVATAQDSTYESDHYFTVTLGTPTSTGTPPSLSASNSSAIGIIEDGDDAPTVQFDPASVNASEEAGAATLTVTRTGATLVPSSVAWTTADGTAAHPGDYTSATGTVAFGATESSKTITIDITADSTAESAETFSVRLSQPADAKLGSGATATVSVTDDDDVAPPPTVPTVQFRDTALLVYEADPLEFPYIAGVLLDASEAVAADTVVGFTVSGTATNPDFTILDATSGTSETILAGEDEATFNIRVLNDDDHEPDETVILTLVDGDGYDLGEQTTLTVTIRDTPDMEFATAMSEALEGATATVTINASHAFTEAADVAFTLGGTATAADHTAPTSPVRFSVGATTATIGIPIAADMDSDTGETIILTLTDGNGYDLGAQATHTITTEDNEALLPLTVRFTASGSRVLESAGTATVTVEASRPASEDTDVAFTVTHPSQNAATAGTDYTTPTSPVTIASGQTAATISIPILDDNDDCTEQGGVYSCPDDGEKFILTLTDGADYDLADTNTRHTVTIFEDPVENDEGEVVAGGQATINLTRPRLHLTEGGPSVQYGISLTRNPMANVNVYVTSPDIGLFTVAGADGVRYQQIVLRFTRRNWAAPQFVTVQAVQDDDRDSEQNMLIGHAIRGTQADSVNFEFHSPYFSHNRGGTGDDSGDDIGVALPDLPVYITDDDAAPNEGLTLEYVDADAARPIVIEEGKAATLRLRWSRALTAGETASARLTITGGAHGEDKDYQVTTDTPDVTVEALPVGVTKAEFIVTWAKAATNAAADVKIKTRNDGKRGAGERHLAVELLDAFSADGSAGQNDTPSGVRLKNGPQEERIHVLSRDRLVVRQTTPDGFVFSGLEAAGDEAELTTDNAWTEIDEDGSVTHKVKVSLSRPPTNTGDVVVTVSTSDSDKLSVAGSDDGDGVADTITWVSSGSGTQYRESVTVEFTAEEDGDSDSEVVFVYFTMTSGYGNAHPPGTLVRAFRVDIKDDDGGVIVVPTSLTLTEGANRGEGVPGSEPARRTHQIAVRLNTDPGDGSTVVLTPSVYDVKNTNILSTKVERDKRRLRFTGGASGNWDEYQLIGFSAKADSDSDDDEFFLRWNVSNYTGVTGADIPAVTIQVKDNDPAVRISESELDLVEGASAGSGGAHTYDVVLNAPPAAGEVVTVTPTSSDAGAVSFDASSAAATTGRPPRFGVSNWDTPQRLTIYALSDSDGDDETATITHSVSGGDNYGSVAAPSIAVNVLDKDGPEGIVLSADSVRVEEGGHPVSFTVRLAGRPTGPVSLNVTGAGSAVFADTDLSADGAQTTLEFTQQSWHRPKTVWLSAEDESDPTDTDDEFVTLMVGGAGAPYAALPVAVTVLDDEFTGPTFTVTGSGMVTEGAGAVAVFTVSADITPAGALPVTLNISETADFVAAGDEGDQALSFSATRALIRHSVPIVNDSVAEDDGSITATLKPGAGYRVGTPSTATINVMDDPNDTTTATAAVVVSPTTVTVAANETVTYGINLATDPGGTVTVTPTSGNTSFATVTGQARTFDSTDFGTAQQVTVTGVGAGTTSITHAITTGTAAYPTTMTGLPSVDVTVTAAATAVDVTLSASDGDSDGNAVEGASDSTGYRTVTLTLGRALTGAETVTVPLTVRGATVTTDYAFGLRPATQNGVTLVTSGGSNSAQNPAVRFAAGATTATLRFTPVDNGDRTQPAVSIGAGTPAATGGVTLGDMAGAPIVFSIVDDETGPIVIDAATWPLAPSGLGGGDRFRLIFVTSETRTAESADIDDYNTWVRGVVARGGHANLLPYGGLVKVIGSTASVDARENTGMWDPSLNSGSGGWADGSTNDSSPGAGIYWLAEPSSDKVADNYFDFFDDTWDGGMDQSQEATNEAGGGRGSTGIWTGTFTNGRNMSQGATVEGLGHSGSNVGSGHTNAGGNNSLYEGASDKTSSLPMFGISPVFEVATPELSFDSGGTFSVTEGGTATVAVVSDIPAPAATSVAYTVTDVSATGGTDYTAPSGAFALTAGATAHSLTIDTTQDMLVEGNETFTVRLDAGTGYAVGSPDTATVTITDDDTPAAAPELTFASATYSVAEDGGTVAVTVNANPAPGGALTVNLSSASVTAGLRDYIKPPATFSFPASQSSHTFSVGIRDDGLHEDDETFTLTLGAAVDASYTLGSPATATITITSEDPRPSPRVSVRPADAIASEGGGGADGAAAVELHLSRTLEPGEELSVPYSIDLEVTASASQTGVTLQGASSGNPSTGTLRIAGPNAPQDITLRLSPAANTVDRTVSGSLPAEFRLTGVSGVDGASLSPGAESAKVFVNDSQVERRTAIQVSGGSRLGRREFEEGDEVWILLDGKAGRPQDGGGLRTHDGYNVVIGVQHLTTGFDDLGAAYAGHDAWVGHVGREGDTDYYNVAVFGYGRSAQVRIPISDDAMSEGDERFRVFIAETPGTISNPNVIPNKGVRTSYMGVTGTYNSLDAAPGVDFTIKGQPGGGQRAEEQQAPPSPPAPTQAVSNLRVTAVDAANAKVTWDAVEHATSYEVEYETTSTLVDEDNYVQGVALDWTDTEWIFQHDAAEAMTLTVTVTPAYEDGNGATQLLSDLASSAAIDVGPSGNGDSIGNGGSTDTTLQQSDYSALRATVRGYAEETQHGDDHVNRWKRALAGLGDGDAIAEGYTPMTAAEAQDMADAYSASRWDPVVEALTDLESRQTAEPEPDPIPELSLSGGSAVDEGASASFTIHAHPAPASDLTVSVTVSQSGDYLDVPGAGSRSVTLAAGAATASLAIATADDGADESDGSVSVRIDSGAGYTVASSNHTASVTVRDDDEPSPARTLGACVSVSQWDTVKGYYDSNAYRSPNYGANWYRVLIAYHEDRSDQTMPDWAGATSKPSSAYTVKEAEQGETVWSGWTPVRKVLQCLEKESGQSFAPLLPSSSNSAHEGVVRFVNASPQGGSVNIQATDDSGWSPPPVALHVGPGESVHLTTRDLEQGNAAKGLSGYLGAATGDWRLDVSSERDIRMLPYVRAHDGVLAPMHAIAEAERGVHRVSAFAPANDPGAPGQTGLLRLINRGGEALTARIAGTDDSGAASGEVSLAIPAGESVLLTAAELEGGASGLRGALGDGRGMWRLSIASGGDLAVVNLLRSGGGHLTNLSSGASAALRSGEVHTVPYFPSASDPLGRQGLVRIVNDTATDTVVRVQAHDGTGRYYEPLTLALGAGEAAHLNSRDLEIGNASGGLSGRTGSGTGDWRLDIAGPPGVGVLAYVRAPTGSLMPVHDVADAAELETGQGIGGALMPSASGSSRSVSPGWMGSRMPNIGLDVR